MVYILEKKMRINLLNTKIIIVYASSILYNKNVYYILSNYHKISINMKFYIYFIIQIIKKIFVIILKKKKIFEK